MQRTWESGIGKLIVIGTALVFLGLILMAWMAVGTKVSYCNVLSTMHVIEEALPADVRNVDTPMVLRECPVLEIAHQDYLGMLTFETERVRLPLGTDVSAESGTAYPVLYDERIGKQQWLIGITNLPGGLKPLLYLNPGDEISITDLRGNQYRFEIKETEEVNEITLESSTAEYLTIFLRGTFQMKYRVYRCLQRDDT